MPRRWGCAAPKPDDLRGGDPAENARILRALLADEDHSARRDVVLLNSAAALAAETR